MILWVGRAVLPGWAGSASLHSPHHDGIGGSPGSGWQAVGLSACIWLLILQQPGLDSFAWWSQSSKYSKRASFRKQDPFKSQLLSYLPMSHLPKRVKWLTQVHNHGEINFAFGGRICRFQGCECRERKNMAILTISHGEGVEYLFMEILREKIDLLFWLFSMSTCLEVKQMREFLFPAVTSYSYP